MAVRDVVQAAAGVGGGGEYVEDVFSTYLYTGNGTSQTITNGIDLAGEGGMIWIKCRNASEQHILFDTERGENNYIRSNSTSEAFTGSFGQVFNSNGFSLATADGSLNKATAGQIYASWSFRKSPKFFDVVTWTGNSVAGRQIPHDLGSVPGCIIVKRTNAAASWYVYHRAVDATTPQDYTLVLDLTSARINSAAPWNDTAPTDSVFTVGENSNYNETGSTYVAYLFAHDAGGFGDDGEQNVISCGSVAGQQTINLGWEPQWLLMKRTDSAGDWRLVDAMRGLTAVNSNDAWLAPNTSAAESAGDFLTLNSTGFFSDLNGTYIYIAIRRPMKTPESGTEVFMPFAASDSTRQTTGFPTDMFLDARRSGHSLNTLVGTRLVGPTVHLVTSSTGAETTGAGNIGDAYQYNDSFKPGIGFNWWCAFKRAPGFMDVVAYTGTGAVQNVAHNLGVAPELLIVKSRSLNGQEWPVQVLGDGTKILKLNSTSAFITNSAYWNDTGATESVFTVTGSGLTGSSGATYIAYLFASLPGVSKVSSYIGTGADINVDCGFSAGARFILIKRTDSTGDWYVWDSARGIVSGNDPYLLLNSTAAEVTSTDYIDPLASGFTVTSSAPAAINASGGSYIFLAIA